MRDQRALALTTCLLAATLVGLPWADGGRSPLGHTTLVLLIAVATAISLLTYDRLALARPSPWMIVSAVVIAASALQTLHPDRTIQSLLLLLAYVLAATLAGRGARREPRMERVLLAAGALSGVLVVGLATVWLLDGNEGGFYATLLIGPFGYPNALAGYLLLTGGAAAATWQPDRSRLEKALGFTAVVACFLGLFLARSRGAWIAAGLGGFCWAWIERHRWWPHRRRWIALAGLILAVATSVNAARLVDSAQFLWMAGSRDVADASVQWRLSILRWTWGMIRDHPWFGVGPGAFPVALLHYQNLPYVGGENPHNLYAEVAAEYGLAAGVLLPLGLLLFLCRAARAVRRLPPGHPSRSRRAPLIAAFVAFCVHSAVDLDWSYPAVGLLGAVIVGLVGAGLPARDPWTIRRTSAVRTAALFVLLAASLVALTRYYSATFVTWGHEALSAGNVGEALQYLRQARALNPVSYAAHAWLARAYLHAGNPAAALETAKRTVRIAPADPNTHALAGEMALAGGAWHQARLHFQDAADRAPAAHLRFHAGLFDAVVGAGDNTEAARAYRRAASVFTDKRVLGSEARCLAPGDRYLLARMSRVSANIAHGREASDEQKVAMARADSLSRPDPRGICANGGRPGRTSPEAVVASFWRSVSEGGWSAGNVYIQSARGQYGQMGALPEPTPPGASYGLRLAWVYSLSGGPRRAIVTHQVEGWDETYRNARCARAVALFTRDGWLLEAPPHLDRGPCLPQGNKQGDK